MNLLLITQDFPPCFSGGIAAYYAGLCSHCADTIDVLTIRCNNAASFDADCSYAIHRRPIPAQASLSQRVKMSRARRILRPIAVMFSHLCLFLWHGFNLVRRYRYDLVVVGHLHLLPVGMLLHRLTGCRYGVVLHGGELEHYWHISAVRRLLICLLDGADLIVANSEFTRQQYYRRGVKRSQRIDVVHPGVDIAQFDRWMHQVDETQTIRDETLVLLTVGRLVERKGHATVLRALAQIDQTFPNWTYQIVGVGSEQENLVQLANDLHLSAKVQFLGFVRDRELPGCYAEADIFVMPSRPLAGAEGVEGYGIVYLEAAACGVPSLAGRAGGAVEAVLDGVTGLLVDPSDIDAVAGALMQLLTDDNLRTTLGQAARNRVVQELDWIHQAAVFTRAVDTLEDTVSA